MWGDGDQPEYGVVRREERYNELHGDQPKEGQEGGEIRKQELNSTGGSSWLGTQEDRDDFVTLSDEFLSKTGAQEDDMEAKKEDDLKKIEVSQVTIVGEQGEYVRLVTSLKERVACPGDQPRTNPGLGQVLRTNTNLDMAGLTSSAVGGEEATTWVATASPRDPPSDHSHVDQSSFVKVGCIGMKGLPRGGARVKECGDVHAGAVRTGDNALEVVEVEKSAGLLEMKESSTEPSCGGKVGAVAVVQHECGALPVQRVAGDTVVEYMGDSGSTPQIPGGLEPVLCPGASGEILSVTTDISTPTPSSVNTVLRQTQAGGGVTRREGGVGTPIFIRGCKHDKKGYCSKHEMLGTRKYREIPCLKAGPGGQKVKTSKKKHYFECEVGPSGRGILRQTVLQFALVSPSFAELSGGDQDRVGGGMDNCFANFSSPTVGKNMGATRTEGLEKQMDKKELD